MKPQLEEDRKRRELVKFYSSTRQTLKAKIKNFNLSVEERQKAADLLRKIPRNSSLVRVKNRCVITGRSKGVYRAFKVSRVMLRKLVMDGQFPGVKKASWLFYFVFKRLLWWNW